MGKGAVRSPRTDVTLPTGELGLTLSLKRAEHVVRATMHSVLASEDLTFEHWQILAVLHARPGLRMSDIAQAAFVSPATLTRHMDRLVEHALVIRRIDPSDKRSAIVALSSRGEEFVRRLRALEQDAALRLRADASTP